MNAWGEERCVVTNRVFLLGLDVLYRGLMKQHERVELLICARKVASTLRIDPADVPPAGYYGDNPKLTEYFRLLRAIQDVDASRLPAVATLPAFVRLREVVTAPLFGRAQDIGKLLPAGRDPLSQALLDTRPDWTIAGLTDSAAAVAIALDDFSLVGLAARVHDPVVLAALRETVVLYAEIVELGMLASEEFVWEVDQELADAAQRFVDTFNDLFNETLPSPVAQQAEVYWNAHKDADIVGRCVCVGHDHTRSPVRYYHWGICRQAGGELSVQDFWRDEMWTTATYNAHLGLGGRCRDLPSDTRS